MNGYSLAAVVVILLFGTLYSCGHNASVEFRTCLNNGGNPERSTVFIVKCTKFK